MEFATELFGCANEKMVLPRSQIEMQKSNVGLEVQSCNR